MLGPDGPQTTESKFRFLYLGNDLKLIAAVRKALTEADYHLVACGDRDSAELFLKSDIRYDALVIDLDWRGKEGLELAQLANSLKHRKGMLIMLAATAPVTREMQTAARKADVNTPLMKSADMESVTGAIRQLVDRGLI